MIIKKIKNKILFTFHRITKDKYLSKRKKELKKWKKDQGDKLLRLNYELNENSVVFDIGGYEGEWSLKIFNKYKCKIYIFEPITIFANIIKNKFIKNNKIKVYAFGLGKKDTSTNINLDEDGSSLYKKSKKIEKVEIKNIANFINNYKIEKIDLMKINIEGGEYDLMEKLFNSDLIKIIDNIQIQFHDFVEEAEQKMLKIQKKLKQTHAPTYQYKFVWENWKKI